MKQVWKFILNVDETQKIHMPAGARLLTVQPQGMEFCLWALVDTLAPLEWRVIAIIGTGHAAPDYGDIKHISTFQLHGGALVLHAFEIVDAQI